MKYRNILRLKQRNKQTKSEKFVQRGTIAGTYEDVFQP